MGSLPRPLWVRDVIDDRTDGRISEGICLSQRLGREVAPQEVPASPMSKALA